MNQRTLTGLDIKKGYVRRFQMRTIGITMPDKTTTVKELKRLARIVINIVEENGFSILGTFTRSYISRTLNCDSFQLEIYLYPHIDTLPVIWMSRSTDELDLTPLINQLKLAGFDVRTFVQMGD